MSGPMEGTQRTDDEWWLEGVIPKYLEKGVPGHEGKFIATTVEVVGI